MSTSRSPRPLSLPPSDRPFVAIDFETADHGSDSACAVGVVRVEDHRIVHREAVLIRPPRSQMVFTFIHGITWAMVESAPTFAEVWSRLASVLDGASSLVAHNASFDRRVLEACCGAAGLPVPKLPFYCTVQIARKRWGLHPNDLPTVCRRLGIGLIHHDPGSDAEACARIVIAAAGAPVPVLPTKGLRSKLISDPADS
jgi:DNA polymerase-3 subunit epsilon